MQKNPVSTVCTGPDLINLFGNLLENPPSGLKLGLEGRSPDLLRALRHQASQQREVALSSLRSLGAIVAVAAQSGEAEMHDLMNMGWLTQWLATFAECMDGIEGNAAYELSQVTGIPKAA